VGEVHVLTSDPTTEVITKRFSESKVDTLAVIRIESGSEESATYSIEVVQHAEGAELVRAIAMVGRVVIRQIGALSVGIANTLVSFASRFKEVRVFLHVLTSPAQSEIRVDGSDVIMSGTDGIAICDGTRPVGETSVTVVKSGYEEAKFDFRVPAAFEGPYVRVDRRVELVAKTPLNSPTSLTTVPENDANGR